MEQSLIRPPRDVQLGELSAKVFDILARYTAFPWPVLKAQAYRMSAPPENLTPAQLAGLVEHLVRGVERFTSPETGSRVRADLDALLRSCT